MCLALAQKAIRFFKIFGPRIFVKRIIDVMKCHALGMTLHLLGNCKRVAHAKTSSTKPNVLFFSCLEWNYRFQRPQHLSRELARLGYNVYYCSPSTIPSRSEGWHIYAMPDSGNLWHVRFFSRKRANLNLCATDISTQQNVAANIQKMVDALRTNEDPVTAIVQHPLWFSILQYVEGMRIAYDCLDDYGAFSDAHDQIHIFENRLALAASAIISTADGLAQRWNGLPAVQKIIRNQCCPVKHP